MYRNESLPLFFCLATGALVAESCAARALIIGHWQEALALHAMVITILVLWVCHRPSTHRFFLLLLLMTAVIGPLGTMICMVSAMVYASQGRKAAPPSEWINAILNQEEGREGDRLHDRISMGLDNHAALSQVEPFQDILSSGTILQKQMVTLKIARYFRPQFAPLLLQAAQDSNAAVRVQAATALAKIEHNFMTQCMQIEKHLKQNPHDSIQSLRLARLYDEYAQAGVLDEITQSILCRKAIAIYEQELAKQGDSELEERLARLYLCQHNPEKTCSLLDKAVESGDITPMAVLCYIEALFCLKRLAQVRRTARRYAYALTKLSGYKVLKEVENVLGAWGIARQKYAA
jgi:polysaccharide biosynthesis protein PelE